MTIENTKSFITRFRIIFGTALFFLIVLVSSCNKEEIFAEGLNPGSEGLEILFLDTFTLNTSTVREDKIKTSNKSIAVLGNLNDPVFGFSRAALITQVRMQTENYDLGTISEIVVDSTVLSLNISNYYGSLTSSNYNVYEIEDDLSIDSSYYTNSFVDYNTTLLGGITNYTPSLDSVSVGGSNEAAQIRINLSTSFGQNLLLTAANNPTNSAFVSKVKGLIIATDQDIPTASNPPATDAQITHNINSGEGSILYINMNSSYSKVRVYYHNIFSGATSSFDFIVDADAPYYSIMQQDYSDTDIETVLNGSGNSQYTYIQSLSGLKTKIEIPSLYDAMGPSGLAINKAALVIPADPSDYNEYNAISDFIIFQIASDGRSIHILDYLEGSTHYGGIYNQETTEYRFNITRHCQYLVNQKKAGITNDVSFFIVSLKADVEANRSRLFGTGGSSDKKIKFELSYTPF